MGVTLLGIGADTTNTEPVPEVYPDGTFEYLPIPEANGPTGTTETMSYGSYELHHRDGTAAEYVTSIRPGGGGEAITGGELESWPLHHDPNFEALTYGETASRASYVRHIRELAPGDVVGFYTGLRSAESTYLDRYLIGYFTVDRIVDMRRLPMAGDVVSFSELPRSRRDAIMAEHGANAHAKRYHATGRVAPDDGLVLIEGREPGGLLDRAFRLSECGANGHHYLTDELQRRFAPEPTGNPDTNAGLGGVKPAHRLRIDPAAFIDMVTT